MSHKRLLAVAVIVAAVIVLAVAAVITVLIEDVRNPPDAGSRAKPECGGKHFRHQFRLPSATAGIA